MIRERGNYRVFLPTRSFLTSFGHRALKPGGPPWELPTPKAFGRGWVFLEVEEIPWGHSEPLGTGCCHGQLLPLAKCHSPAEPHCSVQVMPGTDPVNLKPEMLGSLAGCPLVAFKAF